MTHSDHKDTEKPLMVWNVKKDLVFRKGYFLGKYNKKIVCFIKNIIV